MEAYLTYKARANYSYTLVAVKVELPALARRASISAAFPLGCMLRER